MDLPITLETPPDSIGKSNKKSYKARTPMVARLKKAIASESHIKLNDTNVTRS